LDLTSEFWGSFCSKCACFVSWRRFMLPLLTRATVSLQIKHIGFVLPTGSTNAYLSVHSFLNSRLLESTFRLLSGLEHAMTDTVHKSICVRCTPVAAHRLSMKYERHYFSQRFLANLTLRNKTRVMLF